MDVLAQPEPVHHVRLTKEWAKVLASVSWVWIYANNQFPYRNQTKVACKWCKQESTISLSVISRAVTPMGELVAGLYGTFVKLDSGFVGLPVTSRAEGARIAQRLNPTQLDQIHPE